MAEKLYWLFLVSLTFSVVIDGQVDITFIPSPPVTTVDTAIYHCSSNESLVTIQWVIGNIGTPTHNDNNLISAGVITIGAATTNSSLIIPGHLTQFNDTLIHCLASGRIGGVITGTIVSEVRSAPLLIQGKLDGVGDLMTQPDGPCCVNITWSPPYTLSGVPILGYNINITQYDQLIVSTTTDGNTTEWRYCPEMSREYIISVGAVNGVGEGNITNTSGMTEYDVTKMKLEHQRIVLINGRLQWMIQVNITVNGSVCIDRIDNIQLNCTDTSFLINATNVTVNSDDHSNVIATYTPNVNLTIFCPSFTPNVINSVGDVNRCDVPITIRFVSVIDVTVDIQSDNIVFTCHFVPGSFATGCRIRLFQDDSLLHDITVTRQDNDITGSTSLPKDSISSGAYTVEVYNKYSSIPNIAYSTTITITVPTSTDSVDMSSVTDSSISISPTVDDTIPTDPVLPIIIAVIIFIILLVIVIVIVCSAIFIIYQKRKNKKISVVNYQPDVRYVLNEVSYNGHSIRQNDVEVDHTSTNDGINGPISLTSVLPHGGGGGQYSTLPAEYTSTDIDVTEDPLWYVDLEI